MNRNLSIDYLKSFVTTLVVFHHAALAYTSFSYFDASNYVASVAPVVDSTRWPFLDPLVGINDTFFMPLMFLLSGLFVLPSIESSGNGRFVLGRLRRIGLPFAISSLAVVPLAYLPSWLSSEQRAAGSFLVNFYTTNGWPSGPAWFLWALIAFSLAALVLKRCSADLLNRCAKAITLRAIFLLTTFAYVPIALLVGKNTWGTLGGPLDMQSSRVGLYFLYFLLGSGISLEWGRLKGAFCRFWPNCLGLGLVAFSANIGITVSRTWFSSELLHELLSSIAFSMACAGISLGLLGYFLKFGEHRFRFLAAVAPNAYGIYLVHYVFVTWLQFLLLEIGLPAWLKFSVVFSGSMGLSIFLTSKLRSLSYVRRII